MYTTHDADNESRLEYQPKGTEPMQLQFNSIEEVLSFASHVSVIAPGSGEVRPGSIDPAAFAEHLGRVAGGNAIAAIKVYRAVFGVGLRESKAAIDAVPVFARRFGI